MQDLEYRKGILLAVSAYCMWGFAPLYFKLLNHVSATEILLHRVIWSFVFMLIIMQFIGGFSRLRLLFKQPKQLMVLTITSILIAGN